MKVFLTGQKGIGKSTIIKKVLEKLKVKKGGFFTEKMDDKIYFFDIKKIEIFHFDFYDDPIKVAKLFNNFGVELLLDSFLESDLIVMDELGFLEAKAEKFRKAVFNIIDSEKHIIGVMKNYKPNIFYDRLENDEKITVFEVTKENREQLPDKILKLYEEN